MRQLPGVSSQENMYEGQYSRRSTGAVTCLETGTGDLLTSMGFQVLNFVDFVILEPKPETPFGFSPRVIDLRCSDWRIRVTAVEGSTAVFKLLNDRGAVLAKVKIPSQFGEPVLVGSRFPRMKRAVDRIEIHTDDQADARV